MDYIGPYVRFTTISQRMMGMKTIALVAGIILLAVAAQAGRAAHRSAKIVVESSARAAVNALNQKEEAACREMDNTKSGTLWAEGGVDLIEGLEPMIGKAAIVKWYDSLTPQLKGAKMEYCTVDWQKIKIQGDWAWEWAITRQKIDFPAQQKPFESEGKMLLILKKQAGGEWKIELESWNSLPAPEKKK